MSKYSGRFLIIKNDICFTDTCGQLQTFYYKNKEDILITSSQKIIKELHPECTINKDKIRILGEQKEFYGYEGLIDNSYLILPNHYLDINKKEIFRYPILFNKHKKPDIIKIIKILEGSFEAITNRYGDNLHMGITGGRDTRCLLAFASKYNDKIKFFQGLFGNQRELILAKKLTKKLNLNFTTIDLKNIKYTKEFIDIYNTNRLTPYYKYIPIKSNLKYYMYKNNKNCMIVTGTCAEIFRCHYTDNKIDSIINKNNYIKNFSKEYKKLSQETCNKYGIKFSDLFYWEQRLGFWNASNSEEYNVFGNIFIPFNNRIVINEFLKFNKNDRKQCHHYKQIIKMMGMNKLLDISYC